MTIIKTLKESESCSVVSDSLQPNGLYSPWNSLGQNTGVGSLSLLQGIFSTQGSNPGLPALQVDSLPAEPLEKPKNTGVRSLSLLQGIFLTQELNRGLLHCRQILYQLSHEGILRILEWVAYSFFSGSSQPRNWTGVTCIAGRFLTNWTIREANIQHEFGLFKVDGYYIWTIWKFWRDDKMTIIIKAVKPFLQCSSKVCWKQEFK